MEFTIPEKQILQQLILQLNSFFFIDEKERYILDEVFKTVISRCEPLFIGGVNILYQKLYSTLIIL